MKKWALLIGAPAALITLIGYYPAIMIHLAALDWVTVFSVGIFMAGSVYAIVERNFIVGIVALGAALVLPWIMSWIIIHWPWIRSHSFFHLNY